MPASRGKRQALLNPTAQPAEAMETCLRQFGIIFFVPSEIQSAGLIPHWTPAQAPRFTPPHPDDTHIDYPKFGNATTRTAEQTARAKAYANSIFDEESQRHPTGISICTDGASDATASVSAFRATTGRSAEHAVDPLPRLADNPLHDLL